jgi:hypothetical protein
VLTTTTSVPGTTVGPTVASTSTTATPAPVPTTAPPSTNVTTPPYTTIEPGSPGAPIPTIPPFDLSGVIPESVPMVISEQLNVIQLAVRNTVGDDVFAGSAFDWGDYEDPRMLLYGTDVALLEQTVDALAGAVRDRITVIESIYSENELTAIRDDVLARLARSDIPIVWASNNFQTDHVEIEIETPDGQPDAELGARAEELLKGLPVTIAFSAPMVPA